MWLRAGLERQLEGIVRSVSTVLPARGAPDATSAPLN